jgi:thiol-disulfide isomerase/thioredoxin
MLRNIAVLVFLMLCAAGYTIYTDRMSPPATPQEKERASFEVSKLPNFSFTDLKGKKHDIQALQGKAIVLNFWASWCVPCVVEFPEMLKLAEATKDKSLFIFLSVDDDKKDIERFLKKYVHALPRDNVIIGHDINKTISQSLFQTYKLPETYLISPDLFIREKIIGADIAWNSKAMRDKIENIYNRK